MNMCGVVIGNSALNGPAQLKYRSGGAGCKVTDRRSGGLSKRGRESALEGAECHRHGFILTDKILGTGAYAKVRLARVGEKKLERVLKLKADLREKGHDMVAIKVISKKDAPSEYINKFMPREIDALRVTYKHPHLIQLYEVFRSESRIYLVMEYAPNGDMLSYINECVLETGCAVKEETARRLFKHILSGVAHCHQLNVVHRDLKCENILLDENDNVKISDFGFACRFPTNRCNMLSTFCGSYAYAAPEILSAKNYDGKLADIWSLGVVLYALVNGRLPFNDQNLNTLLEQTRHLLHFQPWVSPECADLIRKLLRTRPLTRLRMHEIMAHPWVRKHMNTKNMTAFPSSQDFLRVIQENAEKGSLHQRKSDKDEPKLVLKSNGETVRLPGGPDTNCNKANDKRIRTEKLNFRVQTTRQIPDHPLGKKYEITKQGATSARGSSNPQHRVRFAEMTESSRMRNLYRRILKPSSRTDYIFEVVRNEREQEQLMEGRKVDARGRPSPPKTPRLNVRRRTMPVNQGSTAKSAASSPSPKLTKTSNTFNMIEELDSPTSYATTLVPVNVKDKSVLKRHGGIQERESTVRISYRLGLSTTPTQAGLTDVKVSQGDRRKYSASEPRQSYKGKSRVSDFINVHGKTELWKRALRGTLQRESDKNDLRLESPSPRASPVATSSHGSVSTGRYTAKMRLLARRNLLHSIVLKPEPEVSTSEILEHLHNNLPLLNDAAS